MCQYISKEEIIECCEDPKFCVVCLGNVYNEKVENHICENCKKPMPLAECGPFSEDKKG